MSDARRPYAHPISGRAVSQLSDADLSRFVQFSSVTWWRFGRLSVARCRWKRAHMGAVRELTRRVRQDGEGASCQQCGVRRATTHWGYEAGDALRYGHFCTLCAAHEEPGWMVVSDATPHSASRPAS